MNYHLRDPESLYVSLKYEYFLEINFAIFWALPCLPPVRNIGLQKIVL